jgi:hypothetical protein
MQVPETQSAFHQLAQRNAFRRRDARQQAKLFAHPNPTLDQPKVQPAFLRLSAMISQYFIQVQIDDESPPVVPKMRWACHGHAQ